MASTHLHPQAHADKIVHLCHYHPLFAHPSLAELTSRNSLYANFSQGGAAILPTVPASLFSLVTTLTVKSSNICVEMI